MAGHRGSRRHYGATKRQQAKKRDHKMHKGLLRQYISIKNEIQEIEQRIVKDNKLMESLEEVRFKVKGGHGNKKRFDIAGHDPEYGNIKTRCLANRLKREKRIAELDDIRADIEDYVQSIDDSETRRILYFRYIDGMTWGEVAENMGDGWTGDACRIKHQRFLDKER